VSQPGDALLSERNRMQGPGSSTTTTAAARTGVALGDESSSISPPSLLALARELGPSGLMRGTQVRAEMMTEKITRRPHCAKFIHSPFPELN